MGQLNQATQQNASASEELAATAEEMGAQAAQLQELMLFFKVAGTTATPARQTTTHSTPRSSGAVARSPQPTRVAATPVSSDFEKF
jgi:methyl-accepting chemotaxis protein